MMIEKILVGVIFTSSILVNSIIVPNSSRDEHSSTDLGLHIQLH